MKPENYEKLNKTQRRALRLKYIEHQKGLCWHCGRDLTGSPPPDIDSKRILHRLFPPNFFNYPVHLHHDHDTGMTIGAVHARCNAVLWQFHGQ